MTKRIPVRNPRNGRYDYEITVTTSAEISALVEIMRQAQKAWQVKGLAYRIRVLEKLKAAIAHHRRALIDALVIDTGRLFISVAEVDGLAGAIDRWIGIASSETPPQTHQSTALPFIEYRVERQPYAAVGVISPWNFPLTLSLIDALPAVLAGCSVIIKPSEVTPRFAQPLRQVIADVEELRDLVQIVDGDGSTGAALIKHVDVVCFTGSVATGRKVAEAAARNFIPVFLELGGKDPAVVLEDADVDRAVSALLRASIVNTGHACQSIERIYVARSLYDEFLAKLVDQARAVDLNYPDIHEGHIGPIIFEQQARIIQRHLEDAVARGAIIHCGGKIETLGGGLWCRPTVVSDLHQDMALMQEETFGPVLPVLAFDSEDQAVEIANDTAYGLSAAVFSRSLERAHGVAARLDAGGISINDASLTGLMHEAEKQSFKLSGMGESRMGPAGYKRFFRKKAIMTNVGDVFDVEAFHESRANYP
ncbi:aldehyde dehydrogenase family protein [Luteithermobacter gelatinilyticus]|uniref:aldehyde dehydrogenase family protein n=1 Tax=Luteithermobacter gelatinilyticus TaxID=2582913 RepID=UPI001105B2B6|nr:aldehyde dehydrogenase family protein [Luteithermobacter gelatinilyticus]